MVGLKQAREGKPFFKPVRLGPIVTHAACYISDRQKDVFETLDK